MKIEKNIIKGNVSNSNISNIGDQYFINIKDYQELKLQLDSLHNHKEKLRERIQKYPDDDSFKQELLQVDKEYGIKEKEIDSFKKELINLAKTLQQIDINTERLKLAKQYFDEGQLDKARNILDVEKLLSDQDKLIKQNKTLKEALTENRKKLRHNSNEFLIKAKLTAINYKNKDWFERTKEYFEKSINADRNIENLFAYALFLQENGQNLEALPYYKECIEIQKITVNTRYISRTSNILNNLGVLYTSINQLGRAEKKLIKALEQKKRLAHWGPKLFLPHLASTLNNLGKLQQQQTKFQEAENTYVEALKTGRKLLKLYGNIHLPVLADTLYLYGTLKLENNQFEESNKLLSEAVNIRIELKDKEPLVYLPTLADTYMSLGVLYHKQKIFDKAWEYHNKALKIKKTLAESNPYLFNPDVANILNNIAVLHKDKNEFKEAEERYKESININEGLCIANPQQFIPDLSLTQINLSKLYQDADVKKKQSITLVKKVIENFTLLDEIPPYSIEYLKKAFNILQNWNIDITKDFKEIFNQNSTIKSIWESFQK